MNRETDDGFTLIEILIVILIIGILAAYFGQNLFGQTHDAKTKISEIAIETRVPKALAAFFSSHPNDADVTNADLYARGVPERSPWGRQRAYRLGNETDQTIEVIFPIFPTREPEYVNSTKLAKHFLAPGRTSFPHRTWMSDIATGFPAIQSIYIDQWGILVLYRRHAFG